MSQQASLIIQQLAARCILEECSPEELSLPQSVLSKVNEVYQARLIRGIGFAIKVSLEDLKERKSGA